MRPNRTSAGLIALLALASCRSDPPAPAAEPQVAAPQRVDVVKAPAGDVAPIVKHELESAATQKRKLIVYVGAPWCEPCQRFHDAAAKGELDGVFPDLRLLEFNLDEDRDRLAAAGYTPKMIPLFAVPKSDGTESDYRIEGSIKGDGAVAQIRPRLSSILDLSSRVR